MSDLNVDGDLSADHVEADSGAEEGIEGSDGAKESDESARANSDDADSQDSIAHRLPNVALENSAREG